MKTFIVLATLSTLSIFASKDLALAAVDNIDGRIINGYLNKPDEIPYIVHLIIVNSMGIHLLCGGSIIDHEWILTAAHCLKHRTNVYISYGTINSQDQHRISVGKEDFFIHKNFSRQHPPINDIALIRTPYVEFNVSINKITLPNRTEDNYANQWARASGWGLIRPNIYYHNPSNLLQSVDVQVVSNDDCARQFPIDLQDTHLCTSIFESKSMCAGDSGGPLVLNANETPNETPILIGLDSFRIDINCRPESPNVFTRISKFLDWIENTMESVNSKIV